MTDDTRALYEAGERRLRERRVAVPADATTEVLNMVTQDRDRLKAEVRRLTALVAEQARQIELGMRVSPRSAVDPLDANRQSSPASFRRGDIHQTSAPLSGERGKGAV
jgi:hypothetical protein